MIEFPELEIRESFNQIEFQELDIEYSVQMKVEGMTNVLYGEELDELYKCEHCRISKPDGTEATRTRTLINLNKYMIIQLKVFGFDQVEHVPYKIIPKLKTDGPSPPFNVPG